MRESGATSYHIVKGWFEDTLASFTPPIQIAVLRIDCDWYAPIMTCLRALFPHLAEEEFSLPTDMLIGMAMPGPFKSILPPTTSLHEFDNTDTFTTSSRDRENGSLGLPPPRPS